MFFDYDDEIDDAEDIAEPEVPQRPESLVSRPSTPEADAKKAVGKWKRVERRIYSPFWRAMHNIIAHPMLAIYRPLGEALHEFTARKMYEPRGGLPPIVTNND